MDPVDLDLWAEFLACPRACLVTMDLPGGHWDLSGSRHHCWTWFWLLDLFPALVLDLLHRHNLDQQPREHTACADVKSGVKDSAKPAAVEASENRRGSWMWEYPQPLCTLPFILPLLSRQRWEAEVSLTSAAAGSLLWTSALSRTLDRVPAISQKRYQCKLVAVSSWLPLSFQLWVTAFYGGKLSPLIWTAWEHLGAPLGF